MKYGVRVEGWQEWKPEKRQEVIMKFLRSKYPEIENKKELYFSSNDKETVYGPSKNEKEVKMYYGIKKEKERGWKVMDLRNIEWYMNVEEILKEEGEMEEIKTHIFKGVRMKK